MLGLRIKADFSSIADRELPFSAEVGNFLRGKYPGTRFTEVSVSEGTSGSVFRRPVLKEIWV